MLSFISSLEIANGVVLDPNIFIWIAASISDDAAVNPNNIKTLLANGLSTFPIKGNPFSSNGPKSLPKNPSNYPILCNRVFDTFLLAHEAFAKNLQSFETCVLVNNNLWGKSFSSLESLATLDEVSRVTLVPFFIPDFNSLICELDNFTFKALYWVTLYWYYIKTKYDHNALTVLCQISKTISLASSLMKNIVVFPSRSRSAVKLIYCIAFGSALSTCCLLKSNGIIL